MAEPSKDELRKEIAAILKDANLEETAAKKVRLQLEANLNCDLSNRKKEVDDLVMEYVNAQDESGEEEEEDEEEEEEKKPVKKNDKKPAGRPKKKTSDDDEDEEDDDDEDGSDEDAGKKKGKRGAPGKRGGSAKKKKRGSDSEEDSDGSGESDDDYKPNKGPKAGAKKAGRKKAGSGSDSDDDWKKAKPKAKKGAAGGRKSTGFTRPYTLSPELAAICGADSLPRHEVVKKVWAIIKERNLYDPKNKQFAICDSELQKVIGVKRFRTFGMLKYLKPHFLN